MKFYIILAVLFIGCKEPIDTVVDNHPKTAEHNINISQANNKQLDLLLRSFHYIGIRDSFIIECHKNEVMYYRYGFKKYRRTHDRLVDSVHKYCDIIHSLLNQ